MQNLNQKTTVLIHRHPWVSQFGLASIVAVIAMTVALIQPVQTAHAAALPGAPIIDAITPNSGVAGNTVEISGHNFTNALTSLPTVYFGTTSTTAKFPAQIVGAPTEILVRVKVPTGLPKGTVFVYVVNDVGSSDPAFFTVIVPVITGMSPNPAGRGQRVTITGTNLTMPALATSITQVHFGNAATVNPDPATATPTSIVVVIPEGLGNATYQVTVENYAGTSDSWSFTIANPIPIITSVYPLSAPVGAWVNLTGRDLYPATGSSIGTQVRFSNQRVSLIAPFMLDKPQTNEELNVTVPAGLISGEIVDITVETFYGISNRKPFTVGWPTGTIDIHFSEPQAGTTWTKGESQNIVFDMPPLVYSGTTTLRFNLFLKVTNASGGMATMRISPIGGWTKTQLGNIPHTEIPGGSGRIQYIYTWHVADVRDASDAFIDPLFWPIPNGAKFSATIEVRDGTDALVDSGNGVSANFSLLQEDPRPKIKDIQPLNQLAGRSIDITGSKFGAYRNATAKVSFSQNSTTIDASKVGDWSDGFISQVEVPASLSVGPATVTVTTATGTSDPFTITIVDAFLPNIDAISPNNTYVNLPIDIYGANFSKTGGAPKVSFTQNGKTTDADVLNSWDDTKINVVVPASLLPGSVTITVATSAGISAGFDINIADVSKPLATHATYYSKAFPVAGTVASIDDLTAVFSQVNGKSEVKFSVGFFKEDGTQVYFPADNPVVPSYVGPDGYFNFWESTSGVANPFPTDDWFKNKANQVKFIKFKIYMSTTDWDNAFTSTWVQSVTLGYTLTTATDTFTLEITPTPQSVPKGGTVTYTVAVLPPTFAGTVTLESSFANFGSDVTASFGDSSITGAQATLLTVVTADTATPTPPKDFTVTGKSSGKPDYVATAQLGIDDILAGNFALNVTPSSQTVAVGGITAYEVRVLPPTFAGTVHLESTFTGFGTGVIPSFGIADIPPGGQGTALSVQVLDTATPTPPKDFTITGSSTGKPNYVATAQLGIDGITTGDFVLSVTPTSQTVALGHITSYEIKVLPPTFTGTVHLTSNFDNFGSGIIPSFGIADIPPGGQGTALSVQVLDTATPTPPKDFTITGTSDGKPNYVATAQLGIEAPAGPFTLSIAPPTNAVVRGSTTPATYTVTVTPSAGFSGRINLSSNLDIEFAGVTGTFDPTYVEFVETSALPKSSTLSIVATSTATLVDDQPFNVYGYIHLLAPTITRTATANLTVADSADVITLHLTIPVEGGKPTDATWAHPRFTLRLYNGTTRTLNKPELATDTQNQVSVVVTHTELPAGTYTAYARSTRHLWSKSTEANLVIADTTTTASLTFPTLTAGNLDDDNRVMSPDLNGGDTWAKYSLFGSGLLGDFNNDGKINMQDISYITGFNWFKWGDQLPDETR